MGNIPEIPTPAEKRPAPDPVVEAYKVHVDRTLIREQLRRSVDERVARMIGALRLVEEMRAAGRRSNED